MIFTMFMSGIFVNPVRKGVDDIEDTPVLNMMREIHEKDPHALWVVDQDNDYLPMVNCGLLIGAPTINSTNVYLLSTTCPQVLLWTLKIYQLSTYMLKLIHQFSTVVVYKVNIQKSVAFL